jgi:hypothetical protein
MESRPSSPGIAESPTDWEAGDIEMPAARHDYARTSPPAPTEGGIEDELNSDFGNTGRDVHATPPTDDQK